MVIASVIALLILTAESSKGETGDYRARKSDGDINLQVLYGFTIDIWIDYNWNIDEIDIYDDYNETNETIISYTNQMDSVTFESNYTITYSSLWTEIKSFIDKDGLDLAIIDTTTDKHNLTCSITKVWEFSETNATETLHITIDATSSLKSTGDKLQDYVENRLQYAIFNLTNNYEENLFLIINVDTDINTYDPNLAIYIIAGGIPLLFCFICFCICTIIACKKCKKTEKQRAKVDEVKLRNSFTRPDRWIHDSKAKKKNDEDPFIDGIYKGYYTQDQQKYKMEKFKLEFVGNIVEGNGTDGNGEYKIKGMYSTETQRMILTKEYNQGIAANRDYKIKVQLEYEPESEKKEFRGKWHVQTNDHEGSGDWVIRRYKTQHRTSSLIYVE